MVFGYDVEASLTSTAQLVNTLAELSDSGDDELKTLTQLDDFTRENRYSGVRTRTQAELDGVRAIREPLRALWAAGSEEEVVDLVNGMLRETRALPQLVRHGPWGWHLHATADDTPFADRILVESAMAWVDVIRSEERDRMRICAADDCEAVLVDFSRNRSKRYCDVGNCGNRANVAAYRARQAGRDENQLA
ncbi:MAG TPA: CGNR zinc finger domain-containing protein [Galbitalea sp.]|jgi:predicted RNA-binding Zn ribbon-like protein